MGLVPGVIYLMAVIVFQVIEPTRVRISLPCPLAKGARPLTPTNSLPGTTRP